MINLRKRMVGGMILLLVLLACLLLPAPAFANMGPPSLLIAYGTAFILIGLNALFFAMPLITG